MNEEAVNMITSMIQDEYQDGIKPGVSCFAACMLSAMKAKNWESIFDMEEQMVRVGVLPTSITFHGVLLSSVRLGKREKCLSAIRAAMTAKLPMNRDVCRLAIPLLLPEVVPLSFSNVQGIRETFLQLGKKHPAVQHDMSDIIKALRMAAIEDSRHTSQQEMLEHAEAKRARHWKTAMTRLIELSEKIHPS